MQYMKAFCTFWKLSAVGKKKREEKSQGSECSLILSCLTFTKAFLLIE